MRTKEIDHLVDTLKGNKLGCSLLIGAGCSVTAGIPEAEGFVKIIEDKYKYKYREAIKKTYPECMAKLWSGERRDLIKEYVDKAIINWTHICIALLIKEGYVDRVLTTNFDPLVLRACALLQIFPGIYDFAASQSFKPNMLHDEETTVFHLHGQHTGFILLNTNEEIKEQEKNLKPLFEDAHGRRVWIVVGYSGKNDPVINHLSKVDKFLYGLYWIAYEANDPVEEVREELLEKDNDSYIIKGYDSDRFFITLAQRLGIFPLDFVSKPLGHMKKILEKIPEEYTSPDQKSETPVGVVLQARKTIDDAIDYLENRKPESEEDKEKKKLDELINETQMLFMRGEYHELITKLIRQSDKVKENQKIKYLLSSSLLMIGNILIHKAEEYADHKSKLYQEAIKNYKDALRIDKYMHEAWNNWGNTLFDQAKLESGAEANSLFKEGYEKYEKAVEIKPDYHDAWFNWGTALSYQAKHKSGAEADSLFKEAYNKYEKAVEIKPDYHEAWNNWGIALSEQAKQKSGAEANNLFKEAYNKYDKAVEIKPDYHDTWNNWGTSMMHQANQKSGAESKILFNEAINKFNYANSIKDGVADYNIACCQALQGNEDECRKMLESAQNHHTLASVENMMKDDDLESVRNRKWFKGFIRSLKVKDK